MAGEPQILARIQLGEAKRSYKAHFISKLTDCDGENSETETWLDYARDCGYMDENSFFRLADECKSIGAMLGAMMSKPESFLKKK